MHQHIYIYIYIYIYQKLREKLTVVNNFKLTIGGNVKVSVVIRNVVLKNLFIFAKDLCSIIILGTLFINLITPYKVNEQGIYFKVRNLKMIFPFIEKPKKRNLNLSKVHSIYNYRINKVNQTHLMHL